MRGRLTVATTVLLASLGAGCGTAHEVDRRTPPVQLPVPTVHVVTAVPTTAAPQPGQDVIVEALRSAPAACGLPVHHLVGYRGRAGGTQTLLQVKEGYQGRMPPVEPVEVDLTDDGALDLVGVLSCTVDDTPRPDSLVLYTGPATPVAALDLATVSGERSAVVRALRVVGGDVAVEWTAFDQDTGPVRQYEGVVRWNGRSLQVDRARVSSGPRDIQVTSGTFMTADGNVHCVMHPGLAWCDVSRSTWTPPPSPPPATPTDTATGSATARPTEGCGDRPYGRTFLIGEGRARQTCRGEQGPEIAALGTGLTSWHRHGWDATVTVDDRRSAALTPGSSMSSGGIRCQATASDVTCTDERTLATFTAGRTTSRVSSG